MSRTFFRSLAVAGAIFASTAAHAQPAPAVNQETIDPQRLALAKTAVDAIIPPGTMHRVMRSSMTSVEDAILGGMFDLKGSDLGATGDGKEKTLREVMAERDPHFEERMRITNRVMAEEMGGIFVKMEPRMREGMSRAYARRFSLMELTEINRFFSSPAGGSFARQSFELMADPELMKEMTSFMPEMMKEMPSIAEKLAKATAHLPPPPTDEDEEEAEVSETDAVS